MKPLLPGRVRCCIVGCGRTFKGEGMIVCGKHWRLADKDIRTAITDLRRKSRRYGWSPARARRFDGLWELAMPRLKSGRWASET